MARSATAGRPASRRSGPVPCGADLRLSFLPDLAYMRGFIGPDTLGGGPSDMENCNGW
jgi:hypothetical protein